MQLTDKKYDRTYIKIDLNKIRQNILTEKKALGNNTKLMAIIKSDAYGHGAIPVARALSDFVCGYGVAVVEEALKLRAARVDNMILVLGYTGTRWFEEIIRHDISQAVYSLKMARHLDQMASISDRKAKIHIKVDTGMGRLGFLPTDEAVQEIKEISKMPGIEIEGVFTHFARADEETPDAARGPFKVFTEFVEKCEKEGVKFKYRHAANSAAIINFKEAGLDMARSGISTYGMYPSEEIPHSLELSPALEWHTKISFLKEVESGTPISYGGTFVTDRKSLIATVPVGYADGMMRSLSGKGRVLVRGEYAPIAGRICMDQFMIDVTDIKGVSEGDDVVIIGKDGSNYISIEEQAELAGSFNYEFACRISSRVPRMYVGDKGRY